MRPFMFLPAVLWTTAIWTSSSAAGAERLNVLLLVSDDCRAIQGCYGQPTITPHIDRLASGSKSAPIAGQMKSLLHAGWQAATPE